MPEFRLPLATERATVIGRTGSGKSVAGLWVLSHAPYDKMPFLIYDYKGDEHISKIHGAQEVGIKDIPKKPGIYVTRPTANKDDDAVNEQLSKILQRENIGLFFDEGYMIPNDWPLQAILTQGRSKHIPVIALLQRPRNASRFFFSEADHFMVFGVSDRQDQKRIAEFYPEYVEPGLPKYHSKWYNVPEATDYSLKPVPDASTILGRFNARLGTRRRII